jgi:hypothetical protein
MTLDQWLIFVMGLGFLAIPVTMLVLGWRSERKRRRSADELTALWDGPDYWGTDDV